MLNKSQCIEWNIITNAFSKWEITERRIFCLKMTCNQLSKIYRIQNTNINLCHQNWFTSISFLFFQWVFSTKFCEKIKNTIENSPRSRTFWNVKLIYDTQFVEWNECLIETLALLLCVMKVVRTRIIFGNKNYLLPISFVDSLSNFILTHR